ncbi:trypsin-like peptidase domain-containing protein [Pedobacter frigidisoli]|uniref:trypsin-like peptidase domain-containing protein n=1 Tax=Pedobacter frigidisoli TaxID=2530455 RepID=UPI00292E6305|nr:trypsin-like peptidase domain-containing protein [Pedobacter frigidisoli]
MKNNYKNFCACMVFLLIHISADAQQKKIKRFEDAINLAIGKAYPASVRMWGFDLHQNQRTSAQFSGVVVTADGYILTAAHTTIPGTNYKVFFPDGRECIALALGRIDNPATPGMPDVGLMKITDKGVWPFAEMGYSGKLVPNEPCLSIAYPESLNQNLPTIRIGKVAEVKNQYGFIRSTCKMEPGDSGGPLFDASGRVIGLHSAIDVAEDQNFEIPVDLYRKYWTALAEARTYTSFPEKEDAITGNSRSLVPLNKGLLRQPAAAPKLKEQFFLLNSLLNDQTQHIQATLFTSSASGAKRQFLISKNSMLGENPKLTGYPENQLKVLSRDKANDLVLIEVQHPIPGGIDVGSLMDDSSAVRPGQLIYAIMGDGIVSSNLLSMPKVSSQPYLGAMVMYNSEPAQFSLIKPDSPAGEAGLKIGDELLSINGKTITKADEFAPALMSFWPGDEVVLKWKNDSGSYIKPILLASRLSAQSKHPAEQFAGGKSVRRDGFEKVFIHDIAIKPEECGGPLFDRKGHLLGITIARYSRTSCLAIPTAVLLNFLKLGM